MSRPTLEIQNLTKSCNEALILGVLRDGPKHGYQLALDIEESSNGYFVFNHGTLYPILHKLEKEGLIQGTWSDNPTGRKKKSYSLTKAGRLHAKGQASAWQEFMTHFYRVTGGESS